MAKAMMGSARHDVTLDLFRKSMLRDPGGAVPEAIELTAMLDDMKPDKGRSFRADLMEMAKAIDPVYARHIGAGRVPEERPKADALALEDASAKDAKVPPARERDATTSLDGMVAPSPKGAPQAEFETMMRMTPEERRKRIDGFEDKFQGFSKAWRKEGLPWAPRFMDHYLSGKGGSFGLKRNEAREFKPIQEAEAKNRQRVERSFVQPISPSGQPSVFYTNLLRLIEGKATEMGIEEDYWQVSREMGLWDWEFHVGERDFGRSLGSLGVNADVTAKARREGNLIYVDGAVEHWFFDLYDFEGVRMVEDMAAELEGTGRARRFDIGAGWKQRFTAIIEIDDGKPKILEFHWRDTDEPVDWRDNKTDADERRKAQQAAP